MSEELRVEIIGGAGPYEAAAIMAAIDAALTEELTLRASPSRPPRQGAWANSGRPQVVLGPRTSFDGLTVASPFDEWEEGPPT